MLPNNSKQAINELSHIASILNQWGLLDNPLATELVERAFKELSGAGRDFLNAVSVFEHKHGVSLRDNATPPHVYFEKIMEMGKNSAYEALHAEIGTLLDIERQKAVWTVGVIERFQDFFAAKGLGEAFKDASQETCEKEYLKQAMHITGTVVRQVINHLMDTEYVEINFSKNPWIRAGIPLRHTASRDVTRVYYHRQVA